MNLVPDEQDRIFMNDGALVTRFSVQSNLQFSGGEMLLNKHNLPDAEIGLD